jgi:hypothetical protein
MSMLEFKQVSSHRLPELLCELAGSVQYEILVMREKEKDALARVNAVNCTCRTAANTALQSLDDAFAYVA